MAMLRADGEITVDPWSILAEPAAADRLVELGLPWSRRTAAACAALRFRRQAAGAPALVGLLGGASSGKSTLFNALIGDEVSRISAHAHETRGPVAAVHDNRREAVRRWLAQGLLPGGPTACEIAAGESTIGELDRLTVASHRDERLADILLIDMPDVTSRMAADEGSLTASWLPWFDALIVVVDEERWFDAAVFTDTAEPARQLGAQMWIVFNSTAPREELQPAERQRLQSEAAERGAEGHAVSPFRPGCGYRPVADEVVHQVQGWLRGVDARRRVHALSDHVRRKAQDVVHTNAARQEQFSVLRSGGEDVLGRAAAGPTLALDLLDEDSRRALAWSHRWLPIVAAAQGVWGRLRGGNAHARLATSPEELAAALERNFAERFAGLAARLDDVVARSSYQSASEVNWHYGWRAPAFDAAGWAQRVHPAITAFRKEAERQRVHGDTAAVLVTTALVVADLLATGGLGSMGSILLAAGGFLGAKPLYRGMQGSPAFTQYQQEVRDYQQFLWHHVRSQWEALLLALPRRHLNADDPLLAALRSAATPGGAAP